MSLRNSVQVDKEQNSRQFNLAVFVSGSGSNLQAIIDAVESAVESKRNENKDSELANVNIVLVISDREGAYALERAKKHGIKSEVIGKNEAARLLDTLKSFDIDGIVLAGYLSILPSEVIDEYKDKIINIHPALLPMFGGKGFYGMKVHQAVIESGEKFSGATIHLVDSGIDTGAVLARFIIEVLPDDTPESLQKRVIKIEHNLVVDGVKILADSKFDESVLKNHIICPTTISAGIDNMYDVEIYTRKLNGTWIRADQSKKGKNDMLEILVVGSGGREHAIGWKLLQNPHVRLYFAPGNGGTATIGENVDIKVDEIQKLVDFAKEKEIDMTVIGPEVPLTMGIVDEFNKNGLPVFGPSAEGAKLEGSKTFAKQFMNKYDIPTARYDVVTSLDAGLKVLEESNYPLVIKADGLAAGKGVIICENKEQAEATLKDILDNSIFGDAGNSVVIEEFLVGKEVSLLCFTDGETIIPMETASDYKRALDNDMGANTGGMGSISPSPYYTQGLGDEITQKTLNGIKAEGFDYRGVIYIGLILTADGPKVLEYNARFGDPETEALLPRLETDLVKIMIATIERRLSECNLRWSDKKAVCVIMTSKGYPDAYDVGYDITIPATTSTVFHAGTTKADKNSDTCNKVVTAGGRVLALTALGDSYEVARKTVYDDVANIEFKGSTYRSDIGAI